MELWICGILIKLARNGKIGDIVVDSAKDDVTLKPPKIYSLKILSLGQIVAYPKINQEGVVILKIPTGIPNNIGVTNSLANFNLQVLMCGADAPNNKATDNNALQRLNAIFRNRGQPDASTFKVSNKPVDVDPAPGQGKTLVVNYTCGGEIPFDVTAREGKYARLDYKNP